MRRSDHVFGGLSQRRSLSYYCFRYRHSRVMCVGRTAGPDRDCSSLLLLFPAASAVLGPVPEIWPGSQQPRRGLAVEAGIGGLWAACWRAPVSQGVGPWGIGKHDGSKCEICGAVTGKANRKTAQTPRHRGESSKAPISKGRDSRWDKRRPCSPSTNLGYVIHISAYVPKKDLRWITTKSIDTNGSF